MKIAILTSGGDSAGMNAVVRSVVKTGILKYVAIVSHSLNTITQTKHTTSRGCEMYVVREGYEGLVRGNSSSATQIVEQEQINAATAAEIKREVATLSPNVNNSNTNTPDVNLLHNLRFGDGDLLKDGSSESVGGRTLDGRYIVRVGWDDVRGWFSEVSVCRFVEMFHLYFYFSTFYLFFWSLSIISFQKKSLLIT